MSESKITDIVARLDVLPVSRSAAGACPIDGPCLEIVETEERLCEKLVLLDQHFVKRLRAEIDINGVKNTQVDHETIDKWFSIIPTLLEQHRRLLSVLHAGGIIGLGIRFKHFFKTTKQLYGDYAAQFQGVSEDIRQARDDNPWLNTFIRVSERVVKDSLLSLRIAPIQRIPRYSLMLTAVLNSLSPDRIAERKAVSEAIRYVDQTCKHIDQSASLTEHSHLVRRIEQDMFQGRIRLRNVQSRKFVYQGALNKMYAQSVRHVTRMKTYTFLLFSDCLIYADLDAPIDRRLKHVLDLSQMRIVDVLDGQIPGIANAFRILSRTKVIIVNASSLNEKRFWINILLDQIEQAVAAAGSRAESPYSNLEKSIKLDRPTSTWPTKFSSLTLATFSQ